MRTVLGRTRAVAAIGATALLTLGVSAAAPAVAGSSGATQTYIVLYKANGLPADARAAVSRAGGTVVATYPQIGVLIARSVSTSFASAARLDARVEGAASTQGLATRLAAPDAGTGDLPNAPASDSDPLSPLQWDMRQIHTPEAHAITGGSRSVLVGDIDTGLDFTHPDLAANYSAADSADCSSGAPTPLLAGNDVNGHGTHTAGTIAAASNGIGIVGVAPNVRIAGIKSSNDDGYFFPEMVVCSFMWAAARGVDVTNNSYFADPWLFNCKNDAEQRAIWTAERRAIRYAMSQGVTVVASAGNSSDDLSHPFVDSTSPDFPPGSEVERAITNACSVVPVEVPGVIGVSANGHNEQTDDDPGADYLKSFYSSYGVSAVDVTAPGGDSIFGRNAEAVNGRVLSTYPAANADGCRRKVYDNGALYCYLQGTSMAGPHVAGVAALVVSRFGSTGDITMRPGIVASIVTGTADAQPCPTALPDGYADFTQSNGVTDVPQECQGGLGHNSWYGSGQVNALRAVTRDMGN
ncbi:MAG: S8 family serine peptidase [Mycobacteriales bacterium]